MLGRTGNVALALLVGTSLGLAVVDSAMAEPPKPPKPVISKLTPPAGPAAGGTTVTIKGKHLATTKKVTFGGVKGTKLKVKNDHKLTVLAPAHVAGAVDVKVRSRGGASKPATFTYQAATVTPPPPPPVQLVAPLPGADQTLISRLADVACPGPGSCTAVGSYGSGATQQPLAERLSGGTWTPSAVPVPAGGTATPSPRLLRVSCPTSTFCAAVGLYNKPGAPDTPFGATWNGATWTSLSAALPGDADVTQGAQLLDMDCASATDCRAVGFYLAAGVNLRPLLMSWNGATWSIPTLTMAAGSATEALIGIDCPAPGECVAVGQSTLTGGGMRPLVETLTLGSPTVSIPPLPADALTPPAAAGSFSYVSCPGIGVCTAGGQYETTAGRHPLVGQLASGTWTTAGIALPADAAAEPLGGFGGLDCPAVGSCGAAATYQTAVSTFSRRAIAGTAGGMASLGLPPETDAAAPNASLSSLDCVGAGSCLVVGSHGVPGALTRGLWARMSGGVWHAGQSLPLLAGATNATLGAVVMDSATSAAAAGSTEQGGVSRGLLVTFSLSTP